MQKNIYVLSRQKRLALAKILRDNILPALAIPWIIENGTLPGIQALKFGIS